jgi:phosphoserine phosphatase
MLCLLNVFKVKRFFRLLLGMVKLRRLERRLRREYKAGKTTLSDADEQLIQFFVVHILAHGKKTDIDRAARVVSGLCYNSAWRCFNTLKSRCDFVIISKSFEFILAKVRQRAAEYGIEIVCYGNTVGEGDLIPQQGSIRVKMDKRIRVKALLTSRRYKKAIIIGDTEDDIAMRDAAMEVLGNSNVVFICMNAKDQKIVGAADQASMSWQAAGDYLKRRFS